MKNKIIIYESQEGKTNLSVKIDGETVWLTQIQLAELFSTTKQNISLHIKNIIEEGELTKKSTVKKYLTVQKEGEKTVSRDIEHYNLDMIISIGYRIKSLTATRFRQWATARLKEYIIKGFTVDDERLKNGGGGNYWKELLDKIRDIRSSEKVLYRQVLDLYSTSIDYNPKSSESITFFKTVQNKLHYAVNKKTAAETIYSRADAKKEFMGLTNFKGDIPVKSDIVIAKNYLKESELFRLNRMVSAFFDLAEIKAQEHVEMYMKDWVLELDKFVEIYGKGKLENSGCVSHKKAMKKAEDEYRKYQVKTLSKVEKDYLDVIKNLEKKVKKKIKKEKSLKKS